jgi:tetratricopeptide (TPR) repeat protein
MLLKRGNPFFLEETVRTLVETGMLAGAPGAYRLMRSVETLQIPATVQTVLAARIDRLPADEKQLLQAAAVVGKDVPYAILTAIAEQPEAALRRGLAHLRELEFLYETRPFPDLEYTFKHALTHEVAYGSVLTDRRRTLHAQIAEVIERLDGDRSTEHIEWLGHHALRGEMWEKAAIYLQRAGAKAFERSANGEAIRCFEQALSALRRLPDSHARIERAADLHLDLRHALLALGEIEAIFDHLREAESRAEMLGDRRRLGRAFGYLAQNFMVVGDYQHSIESGNRARAEGEMIGDLGIQVLAGFNLGQAHFFVGEYRRAAEFQRRTLDSLTGELMLQRFDLAGYPSVTARAWLAMSLAELGQFADALGCAEAGLQLADEVEQAFTRIVAYWGVGYTYLRKGELARAIPVLERGVMLSQASDLPVQLPIIAPYLAAAYTGVGRLSEAISLLEEAREAAVAMKVMFHRSMIMNWLSETYLFAERADEAAELARHALRLARTLGERGHEAWILRLLGTILANRAAVDHNKADASYRTGLRLATSLGMRPLMAHCHLGLAKLYRESDKQLQADEHFAAATTMYRDMGMTFWLEKSETERAN